LQDKKNNIYEETKLKTQSSHSYASIEFKINIDEPFEENSKILVIGIEEAPIPTNMANQDFSHVKH
jgi:hypothetical protein